MCLELWLSLGCPTALLCWVQSDQRGWSLARPEHVALRKYKQAKQPNRDKTNNKQAYVKWVLLSHRQGMVLCPIQRHDTWGSEYPMMMMMAMLSTTMWFQSNLRVHSPVQFGHFTRNSQASKAHRRQSGETAFVSAHGKIGKRHNLLSLFCAINACRQESTLWSQQHRSTTNRCIGVMNMQHNGM